MSSSEWQVMKKFFFFLFSGDEKMRTKFQVVNSRRMKSLEIKKKYAQCMIISSEYLDLVIL